MIRTIFHVADIHIKKANHGHILFSWKKLIELMNKHTENKILIIAGDIFDHKMYLEASDIELFYTMMSMLDDAKIRTFMMPGNHDYNINGSNDDKVKALMDVCRFENIKHFSTSATHDYKNLSMCFHSPIDGNQPKPTEGKTSIAIVHEPLTGSKTDGGITFRRQRFCASDFTNSFHMTMVGDIHMPQLLAPNVAYCGSFVQTNKGEGIEHGCMVWDVANGRPTFVALEQLSVHINVFANANELRTPMPDVVARSINLYHENCSEGFVASLGTKVKQQFDRDIDSSINKTKTTETIERATSTEINKLLAKQMSGLGVESAQLNRIIEYHLSLFDCTKHKTVADWRIKFLAWNNMYCYGENNYINFDDLANLSAIAGQNKIGKSSIIDILILILFNETVRGSKRHALNVDSTKGHIKCVVSAGKDEYAIERVWIDKNTSIVRLFLNGQNISGTDITETYKLLAEIVGTKKQFINSVAALQQRQFLVDIGAKERYELVCRMMELDRLRDAEDTNASTLRNSKKQLSLIKVPIDKVDKLNKIRNTTIDHQTELKQLNAQYTELRKRQATISADIVPNVRSMVSINIDMRKIVIKKVIENIPQLSTEIEEKEVAIRLAQQEVSSIVAMIANIVIPKNVAELRRKVACDGDVDAMGRRIIELKTVVATSSHIVEERRKLIVGKTDGRVLPEKYFDDMELEYSGAQKQIDDLRVELLRVQFAYANKLIGSKMSWNDDCTKCCENKNCFLGKQLGNEYVEKAERQLNTLISDTEKKRKKIDVERAQNKIHTDNAQHLAEIDTQKKKIILAERELATLSDQYDCLLNVAKLKNELDAIERNIVVLDELTQRKKEKEIFLTSEKNQIMLMRKRLSDAKEYVSALERMRLLEDELSVAEQSETSAKEVREIEIEMFRVDKLIDELNKAIGQLVAELSTTKQEIENDKKTVSTIDGLKRNIADMELYNNLINHKNGLPVKMMENTCAGIEKSANKILDAVADFQISVVFDKEIHINVGQVSAEQSSGYQKFLIDLILRQVLCTLTLSAHPRILFIDEGFGSLDTKNFDIVCREMLPRLAARFDKVIIISHVPGIHTHIAANCVIQKIDGRSHVQFGRANASLLTTNAVADHLEKQATMKEENRAKKKVAESKETEKMASDAKSAGLSVFERLNDKELRCKVCDKILKVRNGAAEKHIVSAGHIKKFKGTSST
jgi:DNA repair exonuclease SbcCD nuclease subunit